MDAVTHDSGAQGGMLIRRAGRGRQCPGRRIVGPMLSTVMARLGVAVHEEAVLDDLLACLAPEAS
jgi:hypothetical protein